VKSFTSLRFKGIGYSKPGVAIHHPESPVYPHYSPNNPVCRFKILIPYAPTIPTEQHCPSKYVLPTNCADGTVLSRRQ
jgi:hypothetical protein